MFIARHLMPVFMVASRKKIVKAGRDMSNYNELVILNSGGLKGNVSCTVTLNWYGWL